MYICEISGSDDDDGLGCTGNLFRSRKGLSCDHGFVGGCEDTLNKLRPMDPKTEISGVSKSSGGAFWIHKLSFRNCIGARRSDSRRIEFHHWKRNLRISDEIRVFFLRSLKKQFLASRLVGFLRFRRWTFHGAGGYPKRFKSRREKISELLFSCRVNRCIRCDHLELTIPGDDEEGEANLGCGVAGDDGVTRPISVLLESLRKLQLMSLNLDILKVLRFFFQSTEIGKAVNGVGSRNSKLLMQTQEVKSSRTLTRSECGNQRVLVVFLSREVTVLILLCSWQKLKALDADAKFQFAKRKLQASYQQHENGRFRLGH
ncbi:predicted protein [Arabidopsis lyrata subsp. lyrata]|uniref:Predicted protein n=1 Tax=Arabidopsis lyrata subsp. lyrata TaxID=81972 RepID=D7MI99_ARALL|nr:predicted protein [Arabidopsis lyrata subsp. lyrata]